MLGHQVGIFQTVSQRFVICSTDTRKRWALLLIMLMLFFNLFHRKNHINFSAYHLQFFMCQYLMHYTDWNVKVIQKHISVCVCVWTVCVSHTVITFAYERCFACSASFHFVKLFLACRKLGIATKRTSTFEINWTWNNSSTSWCYGDRSKHAQSSVWWHSFQSLFTS